MLTHRRRASSLLSGYVILFAEAGNEGYGNNVWTLETELPAVESHEPLITMAQEYLGCDREEAIESLNPSDIVNSAGIWDDAQFVSDVWQAFEAIGYRTADGAVVLCRDSVVMTHSVCEE